MVGGGGGVDALLRRDYPSRFITHAAALGARRIAYLLPVRCAKEAFVEGVMRELEQQETGAGGGGGLGGTGRGAGGGGGVEGGGGGGGEAEDGAEDGAGGWSVTTVDAPERTFDFRGRDVPQPSVIQVWLRRKQCAGL